MLEDFTVSSERQKMLAGELYDPLDPELAAARERARDLCQALNATREAQQQERRRILCELFGRGGDTVWMQPPFFCDYGSNIELGERVFFNFNCVVLDVCPVRIGSFSLFGPAVQIYTPMHPFNARLRRQQEFGKPVDIGSDVWVGGGAIILPGRPDRFAGRDWRWQRGHTRRSRRDVRGRQPVPCHPRDHRVGARFARPLRLVGKQIRRAIRATEKLVGLFVALEPLACPVERHRPAEHDTRCSRDGRASSTSDRPREAP